LSEGERVILNIRDRAVRGSKIAGVFAVCAIMLIGTLGCSSSAMSEREASQYEEAKAQYEKGQFADSEAKLLRLLERSPDNEAALQTLALAQAAQGKNEEAVTQYAALVKLDPKDHGSWYRMALLERVIGRADTSVEYLTRALAADPGNPSYTDELARTQMSLGQYAEAARGWGDLLKVKGLPKESRKELLVLQAQAYQAAKDYRAAEKAYAKALKLYPDDKDLKARVDSFQ
jgi:tetratricopeptide (TPR) repeat protein